MKINNLYIMLIVAVVCASCEIDNYDEPTAVFSGNIVYQGEPIRVAADEVPFQLYQEGYALKGPFDVWIAQDGSFSSILGPGDFKLKLVDGQGPFKSKIVNQQQLDTIYVDYSGDKQLDIEVDPYYMIRNTDISLSEKTVSASFSLEKILQGEDGKDIETVYLYINRGVLISNRSNNYYVARTQAEDLSDLNNMNLSVDIPDDYNRPYIYARVGVKMVGVEDFIFSEVVKLDL